MHSMNSMNDRPYALPPSHPPGSADHISSLCEPHQDLNVSLVPLGLNGCLNLSGLCVEDGLWEV